MLVHGNRLPLFRAASLARVLLLIVIVLPASVGARPLFDAARVFPATVSGTMVDAGDFNGDGIDDVVTAYDGDVAIMICAGDGTFSEVIESTGLTYPSVMAVGDLNDDGLLDVVLCSEFGSSTGILKVMLGNGDGTFYGNQQYETLEDVISLRLGDLDSDGDLDVVVLDDRQDKVAAHLNDGSGALGPPIARQVGDQPEHLALGQFNGDGLLDLAVIHDDSEDLRIYTGNGDGTFSDGTILPLGYDRIADLEAADFNDDGSPDLVISSHYSSQPNIRILLGDGAGGFTLFQQYDIHGDSDAGAVTVCLMNDDQILDLAVQADYAIVVLIGFGDGTFRQEIVNDVVGWGSYPVAALDLDRDGDQDLAMPALNGIDGMTALLNRGDGSLQMATRYEVYDGLSWNGTADVDQDGDIDVVLTHDRRWHEVSVLFNEGDDTFTWMEVYQGTGYGEHASIGDFNGDTIPDLAVGITDGDNEWWVEILIGQGDGTFVQSEVHAHQEYVYEIGLWLVNGDAHLDLVAVSSDGIWVRLGNGDGTFGSAVNAAPGQDPQSADAADLDGDGNLDFVGANHYPLSWFVVFGDGGGGFSAPTVFDTDREWQWVRLGDLDQDGDPDLAYWREYTSDVAIYVRLNDGSGAFLEETGWPGAAASDRFHLVDVDGDGLLDVLPWRSQNVCVMPGQGNGGFGETLCFAASEYEVLLPTAGDFDNDGDLDLAAGQGPFYDCSVLIYKNNLTVGNLFAAGPGRGEDNPSRVRLFAVADPVQRIAEWQAYGVSRYGVNVALGELDGSVGLEALTGAGPGAVFGPHVRGFEDTGVPLPGVSFLAYGTNKYGVNVASGDLDGDGFDEIVTGAGPGAVFGPHVRAWNWDGSGMPTQIPGISYFAYGTPKWGVNVACGDIDGDGYDEIVTGAGPGAVYGPHVRGWNCDGGGAAAISGVSFLAYGTNKYGVNVACGDIDGDGIDEMVTGAGPGAVFGPHVRAWNWDGTGTAQAIPGVSFFAYDYTQWGVNVSCGDLDGDGIDEILTGPGPGPAHVPRVRGWNYDGIALTAIDQIDFYGFDPGEVTHGVKPAGLRASQR